MIHSSGLRSWSLLGAAASYVSALLLLWGLAGAVIGGFAGAMGVSLPFAEVLAALAISAVALLILRAEQAGRSPGLVFGGALALAPLGEVAC